MADNIPNPEDIIAREGRLTARAFRRWPAVTTANMDFDIFYGRTTVTLFHILRDYTPLREQYDGTYAEKTAAIETGINNLISQALNELWNRLRVIAETHDMTTRNNVFQRKAPSYDGFIVPRVIASMLSSIGPMRITDTFRDTVVIYAPDQAYNANFGRANPAQIDRVALFKMQTALRACGIPIGTIQSRGTQGSFFPTIDILQNDINDFEIVGCFHHSHYTRNDTIFSLFFDTREDEGNPFEDLSMTIGFTSDAATLAAFRAAAPPYEGCDPDAEPRHTWANFQVNNFGIAPQSNIPVHGRGEGLYILGRHSDYFAACSLARNLSHIEIHSMIRHRILHGITEAPQAPPAAIGANPPPAQN